MIILDIAFFIVLTPVCAILTRIGIILSGRDMMRDSISESLIKEIDYRSLEFLKIASEKGPNSLLAILGAKTLIHIMMPAFRKEVITASFKILSRKVRWAIACEGLDADLWAV